jgi:hypothetical protein
MIRLSEKNKSFQEDVLSLQRQSEKLKSAMDEMVRINGAAAKIQTITLLYKCELARKLSDSQRFQTNMNKVSFIQNMAFRANVLGKMDRKLNSCRTAMI